MFCPKCGNELQSGQLICDKCGTDINTFDPINRDDEKNTFNLVNRAKSGDESAFHLLYERTNKRNYYVALKMVKTDADAQDVLQDAYIRIYQHLDQFQYQGEGSFASWSSKIVSNTALNHLRKKQMVLFSDIEGDQEGEFSLEIEDEDTSRQPELAYDKKETSKIVQDLLGTLSDEQRVCAMMFYFQEESVKDIASEIGCSENTVKSRLNYARKNMMAKAEELKKKGILTGILSIAGLFAILRSNEAMAMEHVPSGVYSVVSGSINWESMAAYASNGGSVATGGAASGSVSSGGAASGSAVSGGAVSGATASGTVATGAAAAGAAVSAGLSIKAIVAIVIASVVVLAGGIIAVVLVNNSNPVDIVSENPIEKIEEESDSDSVSSMATDVNDQKEEEKTAERTAFEEYVKQYTFLFDTGDVYELKQTLSDDSQEIFPESLTKNPIGYVICDLDNDEKEELLILNTVFEHDENYYFDYGFGNNDRPIAVLEVYEYDGSVVKKDSLNSFSMNKDSVYTYDYDCVRFDGGLRKRGGCFNLFTYESEGKTLIALEDYQSDPDNMDLKFGTVEYNGEKFESDKGYEAAFLPEFESPSIEDFYGKRIQKTFKKWGIEYTAEDYGAAELPSDSISNKEMVVSATIDDSYTYEKNGFMETLTSLEDVDPEKEFILSKIEFARGMETEDNNTAKEAYKEYLSNLPKKVVTYVMCGYGWGEDVDGVDIWAQNRVEDASESDLDNRILYDKTLFEKTGRVSDVKTVLTKLLNRYCISDIDEDGIPELILVENDDLYGDCSVLVCKYKEGDVLPLYYVTGLRAGFYITKEHTICFEFGGSDFWEGLYVELSGYEMSPLKKILKISDKYGGDSRPEYSDRENGFEIEKIDEEDCEKRIEEMGRIDVKTKRIKR